MRKFYFPSVFRWFLLILVILPLVYFSYHQAKAKPQIQEKKTSQQGATLAAQTGFSFSGLKGDYATWVRDGYGSFNADDDDLRISPLINAAFLWLTLQDTNAKRSYHDLLFGLKREGSTGYEFKDNGSRKLADVLETYLEMRKPEHDVFTSGEKTELEAWFRDKTRVLIARSDARLQAVGGGLAAVAYAVLGDDDFLKHAEEAVSFCDYFDYKDSWSPGENSAFYVGYLMMSEFRVTKYAVTNGFNKSSACKVNLERLITWILQTYPHNGDTLAYGRNFFRNHLTPTFNILHAASAILKDSNPTLASQSKWMATQMFSYYLTHNQETFRPGYSYGRFEANPMYIWWYVDDTQALQMPTVGSVAIYRDLLRSEHNEDAGWDSAPARTMLDKVVLRDGWGNDSLYIQLEAAPWSNKTLPYGNNITQLVYGRESFLTDHTAEGTNILRGRLWWSEGNTAYAELGGDYKDHWDLDFTWNAFLCKANCYWPAVTWGEDTKWSAVGNDAVAGFEDGGDVITSTTYMISRNIRPDGGGEPPPGPSNKGWKRTIKLYKTGDRRIEVIDELPPSVVRTDPLMPDPGVYWHFQGTPDWKADGSGVVLEKNGYKLDVTWDVGGSYQNSHRSVDTKQECDAQDSCFWETGAPNWGWGYTGQVETEVRLYGATTYTTIFRPYGDVPPVVCPPDCPPPPEPRPPACPAL